MRPLELQIEGFGPYRQPTKIDFTDADLIAFVGPTGSGKSTIIDAITFALYGSVARYDDNRAVAPVIHQTSSQARVSLHFELGGQRYRAVRVVRRTKQGATTPEARLEQGEEVLAADARAVTEAVGALLGLDATQFNKTVVLPQGRFAEFLHDKPAQRQATLRGLLDLGLYERMGRAARQRAGTAKAQADGYAADLDNLERELTEERRQALSAVVAGLDVTLRRVDQGLVELARLGDDARRLDEQLAEIDRTLDLLSAVAPPPGLERLDADQRRATAELEAATVRLERARAARQRAVAEAAASPDLVELRLRHHMHVRYRQAREAVTRASANLEATRQRAQVADARAAEVRERQATLEREALVAREAERAAHEQLDDGPDEPRARELLALNDRHDAAVAGLETLDHAASVAAAAAESAAVAVQAAEDDERHVRAALEQAQGRAGAAGLAATLRIGDNCPVCQHPVTALPAVHGSEELDGLRQAVDRAVAAAATARHHAQDAGRTAAAATAEQQVVRRSIAEMEAALAGQPPRPELEAMLQTILRVRATLTAARVRAREAASAFDAACRDPAAIAAFDAAEAAGRAVVVAEAAMAEQQRQFAEASERVAGGPGETEILSVIAEAERLAKQREQADDELTRAEKDHADARDQRQEVDRRADRARTALDTVRDRIASLGPPAPDRQHVSAAWQQLNAWTRGERQAALDGRLGADTERRRVATASDELERRLRTAVAEQLAPGNGPISALREMLVQERADAAASLGRFDAERRRLEELRARVRSLREDAAVADSLGRLLSATGFESWLMAAALEELCSRATTRLHALSGGQYSLVLDDREFLVRDHHNADELRNVRTLSGGETFLASLALALALAEATAELAPAGAPTIESIFLDEGFGTLDTDTLETVAGAIEELGASGRMVAVVTHIRELADRMPVRLEVTKRPGGASVARVDV